MINFNINLVIISLCLVGTTFAAPLHYNFENSHNESTASNEVYQISNPQISIQNKDVIHEVIITESQDRSKTQLNERNGDQTDSKPNNYHALSENLSSYGVINPNGTVIQPQAIYWDALPEDIYYIEGETGNVLSWTAKDTVAWDGTYTIYQDGILVDSGIWDDLPVVTPITYNVDGLTSGVYNFTIIAVGKQSSTVTDTAFVFVTEETPPQFVLTPANFTYSQASTGNYLNWNVTDPNPGTYTIYRNNVAVETGNWDNPSLISMNIDYLPLGLYNFTIIVRDQIFNINAHTVFVTVVDSIDPLLSQTPGNVTFEEGSTNNQLNWIVSDTNPGTLKIYKNGSLLFSSGWVSNSPISIGIDDLKYGLYNFTIEIKDTSNNYVTDTSFVQVTDTARPVITSTPQDISYSIGTTGHSLLWIASDKNPTNFIVYRNMIEVQTGSWLTQETINIGVNGLGEGIYNYTIIFFDAAGNQRSDTVFVEVTSSPIFISVIADYHFTNDTINQISWTATDTSPSIYQLFRDGLLVSNNSWVDQQPITYPLGQLDIGVYEFLLVLNDTDGNISNNTVLVYITDVPKLVSIISSTPYSEGSTGNSIIWEFIDTFPENYTIYRDNLQIDSGSWFNGTPISLDIDGLVRGLFNYTIVVYDTAGNTLVHILMISVLDTTFPILNVSNDFTYESGSFGNHISWIATDGHSQNFTIYVNDQFYQTGSWSSGENISINVDEFAVGLHNITIFASDSSGNTNMGSVLVTVFDTVSPIIDEPVDFSYEIGSTSHNITWTASDLNSANYTIYHNQSIFGTNSWSSGNPIMILIDGLAVGFHNFTIFLMDVSGNSVTDQVEIVVVDTVIPVIDSPVDFNYEYDSSSNVIEWIGIDLDPDTYVIYRNQVYYTSGVWLSNSPTSINIDGLGLGEYNYTIYIFDKSNNSISDSVIIIVEDTTNPSIDQPSDLNYELGTTSNIVNWLASDSLADTYTVYINQSFVLSDIWQSGNTISISIDGLAIGTYNVTIVFFDTTGNNMADTVWVDVIDTTAPLIDNPADIIYELGSDTNQISWQGIDLDPDNYTVNKDGQFYYELTWTSGQTIQIDIDGLTIGTYQFMIILADRSGNTVNNSVSVTIIDTTAPVIVGSGTYYYSVGLSNNNISWSITDYNSNKYEIWRNSTLVDSGDWNESSAISINVDGLGVGVYNYSIYANDTYGNLNADLIYVIVTDPEPPVVSHPEDIAYVEGTFNVTIQWNATDSNPGSYVIYQNGIEVETGQWSSGVNILYNLTNTVAGVHTFRIEFSDSTNNIVIDTVIVTILDQTPPTINPEADDQYEQGSTLNTIQWTAIDPNPQTYSVFKNGSLFESGTWISGNSIILNIDGLIAGVHNFTIIVYDIAGNFANDTLLIEVIDTTIPFIDGPVTIEYELGSINNFINWNVSDYNADTYYYYINGSISTINSWISNTNISINTDSLIVGSYNYTIVVFDTFGNQNSSMIMVTVIDTTIPYIDNPSDTQYEQGSNGNWIIWNVSDLDAKNYTIFVNGEFQITGNWNSSSQIAISVDNLSPGVYNYTIYISDYSLNINYQSVIITVVDTTIPTVGRPGDIVFSENTDNISAIWTINDLNPNNYSIYKNGILFLSGLWNNSGPITLDLSFLSRGTYEFVIVIMDAWSNQAIDVIYVTVNDTTRPIFINPPTNITFSEDSLNNTISWEGSDNYPSHYILFLDGIEFSSGSWENNETVVVDVDSLSQGHYIINVTLFDESLNQISWNVSIDVIDDTDPNITITPGDINYQEGEQGNSLTWEAQDLHYDTYVIYRNGTQVNFGLWQTNTSIFINVDNLPNGWHNYTIIVYDKSGNSVTDLVWVHITDGTTPSLIPGSIPNQVFPENQVDKSFSWKAIDNHPNYYEIYINDVLSYQDTWLSNQQISYNFGLLLKGQYAIKLIVFDSSLNNVTAIFTLNIVDTSLPQIQSQPNDSVGENALSELQEDVLLIWEVTDNYPFFYDFYINGELNDSNTWNSTQSTVYSFSSFAKGVYNFSIFFYDQSGNFVFDYVIVEIVDVETPIFLLAPNDISFYKGSTGNELVWSASDIHPYVYVVTVNNEIIINSQWQNGTEIHFSLDNFVIGTYVINIRIYDESQNFVSYEVTVTVKDPTIEETLQPDFTIMSKLFEGDVEYVEGVWQYLNGTGVDSGFIRASLFGNDILLKEISNYTLTDGIFVLVLNYSSLLPTKYNWVIEFSKFSHQNWTIYFEVVILPHNLEIKIQTGKVLERGQEYTIVIIITYNNQHQNTSSIIFDQSTNRLSSRTGRVSGIQVDLTLELLYPEGINVFPKKLETDINGIALLTLTKSQTSSLVKILSISVEFIGDIIFNGTMVSVPLTQLPDLVDASDVLYESILLLLIAYAGLIIFLSIGLLAVSVVVIRLRRKQKNQISEIMMKSKNAEAELSSLLSIEFVILQTTSGTPIFEKNIKSSEVDSMLVGGITSAISSFLEELGSDQVFGFDVVENLGLSVLSHKSKVSTLIVVSRNKLPLLLYSDIEKSHQELDSKFASRFSRPTGGIMQIDDEEFFSGLSGKGLKLSLTGMQEINKRNLRKATRVKSFTRNAKQNFQLIADFVEDRQIKGTHTNTAQIFEHMLTLGLSAPNISQVILLAYMNGIINHILDE